MEYSLLLSLYYKEKPLYLNECLLSLSKQTRLPNETVIVFDGPVSNELEEVVNSWKKELSIKIVRLKENVGLGKALNIGLANCSNNIVARADTDDIYSPYRMEEQLRYLDKNTDCVIVGCNVSEFKNEPQDIQSVKKTPEHATDIINYAKYRNPFNHMTVIYKKDFILSIGGYKHHLYMEDYNLWIRALKNNRNVYNIQKNLVHMRIGDKNEMVSRRKGMVYLKSEYQLFKLIVQHNINSFPLALLCFLIRSSTRILPTYLLSKIYHATRTR